MAHLDLTTPYDDLIDLRAVLSAQQIAELTGLRRETISRARPDRGFRRQTARVVTDLNIVVGRLRQVIGEDSGQLAALLERPQPAFDGGTIAELVRAGRVDLVLEHLAEPESEEDGELENLQFDSEVMDELRDLESEDEAKATEADGRAARFVADDPELGQRVPMIEEKVRKHFGIEARVERALVTDRSDPDSEGHLYLGIRSDLPLDRQIDRLETLLSEVEDLLEPVQTRLTIGTL